MKTVILCGGEGTRLRERTESIPKPLVEVGPYPILWHLMKLYAAHGHADFVLCLGYKGRSIKEFFLDLTDARSGDFRLRSDGEGGVHIDQLKSKSEKWDITFAETGLKTDTGGRLHAVRDYVSDDTFSLTYADGVADIDLGGLMEFHRAHGKLATVTAVRRSSQLGIMELDGDSVRSFSEKPMMNDYINGGFFIFEPGVLEYASAECNLESGVLPRLVDDGQLMAYRHDGFWACMDTYKDNVTLTQLWNRNEAPWRCW